VPRPPLPVGTYGVINTKRDGKRWRARCQFRDVDGVVRNVSRWGDSKTAADNNLKEALRDRQRAAGLIKPESKVTEVAELWFQEFREKVDQGIRSGTSYDNYENRWNKLVKSRVIGLRIAEFKPGRVDDIVQDINRTHSASTARNCRAILSGLCQLAVRHGAIDRNPVREASPIEAGKRRKQVPRALTVAEVLHIFELADNDPVAMRQDLPDTMRFFGGTGNRTGEAIAVRWEKIDFSAKVAWVEGNMVRSKIDGKKINPGKTENADRGVPLADWLVDMLLDRRARVAAASGVEPDQLTGWVFPNSLGTLREASNLRRDWRAFRERHSIGDWFTPRTFRRTVATLVTDALPVREASDMLGHSRVSLTSDTYVGRKAPSQKPAAVLHVLGTAKNGSKTEPRSNEGGGNRV